MKVIKITEERRNMVLPKTIKLSSVISDDAKKTISVLLNCFATMDFAKENNYVFLSNKVFRKAVGINMNNLISAIGELIDCDLIERKAGKKRSAGQKATASTYIIKWENLTKPVHKKDTFEELFSDYLKPSKTPVGIADADADTDVESETDLDIEIDTEIEADLELDLESDLESNLEEDLEIESDLEEDLVSYLEEDLETDNDNISILEKENNNIVNKNNRDMKNDLSILNELNYLKTLEDCKTKEEVLKLANAVNDYLTKTFECSEETIEKVKLQLHRDFTNKLEEIKTTPTVKEEKVKEEKVEEQKQEKNDFKSLEGASEAPSPEKKDVVEEVIRLLDWVTPMAKAQTPSGVSEVFNKKYDQLDKFNITYEERLKVLERMLKDNDRFREQKSH